MFISLDILDKFWPDTPLEFAAMWYYGMALHKTVPENRNTVTRLDREEDEISTTLGRSANEKNYAKERLAESQRFSAKLWNKGLATMRLIRSNETRNLTNCKYFDALSSTSNKVQSLYKS